MVFKEPQTLNHREETNSQLPLHQIIFLPYSKKEKKIVLEANPAEQGKKGDLLSSDPWQYMV